VETARQFNGIVTAASFAAQRQEMHGDNTIRYAQRRHFTMVNVENLFFCAALT